jgi:hypothetical protein
MVQIDLAENKVFLLCIYWFYSEENPYKEIGGSKCEFAYRVKQEKEQQGGYT